MFQKKIFKTLIRKFRWSFFGFFLLVFLTNYLTFLIPFNFRNNLTYDSKTRGCFYYLFGKSSVIKENKGSKIYVDWNQLLLILLFLYFPLKIMVQSILSYLQKIYQRKATVFLTKKLLNFAYKNEDLMAKNCAEKTYIVNYSVPLFARQFFEIPIRCFDIFFDLFFDLYWFYLLVEKEELFGLLPFISLFIFVNLLWFILFKWFTTQEKKLQKKRELDFQRSEEEQISFFFGNLNDNSKLTNLTKVHKSLTRNSQKLSFFGFLYSLFIDLPDLIVPGLHVLFLLLYYKLLLGGQGGLGWNVYFIALNVRNIFLVVRKTFNLLPLISSFLKNYQRVKNFFC